MNISILSKIKIFPQNKFSIEKTSHKMRDKVIFNINNLKQELDNIFLLYLFPGSIKLLLKRILNFSPIIFKINSKIVLSNIEQIIDIF